MKEINMDRLLSLAKHSPMRILHGDELYFAHYGERKYLEFMGFISQKICHEQLNKNISEQAVDRFWKVYSISQKRKEIFKLMKDGNLWDTKYRLCNFENYVVNGNNKELFEILQGYLYNSFQAYDNGIGIYIWGEPGTGKTHAMYALANELAYDGKYTVYFTSILDILNGMKKNFSDVAEQENIKDCAKDVDFLFLDDIGAEQLKDDSDWYKSIIYEIIDYRYRQNLPTIFSSNYSKTELVTKRHYDERLVQRIMEMCALEFEFNGEPMRITRAKRRKEYAQSLIADEESEISFSEIFESLAPWWAKYVAEFERSRCTIE